MQCEAPPFLWRKLLRNQFVQIGTQSRRAESQLASFTIQASHIKINQIAGWLHIATSTGGHRRRRHCYVGGVHLLHSTTAYNLFIYVCLHAMREVCCDLCIPTTSIIAPWHSKLSWSCWASKSGRIYLNYMEIWCNMQWSGNPNRCGSKFRHKEPQNRPFCNQTGSESIILNRSRSWNYLGFRYRNHPQSGFH